VDRLYRKAPFKDDAERVSILFKMYKEVKENEKT
ncbi:MAG: type IIL restriction-modification enzyme MmeI, partial [Treponema sp.]